MMNEKYEMVEWSEGCGWEKGFSMLKGPDGFRKQLNISKAWAGAAGWEVVDVAVAEMNRLLAENKELKEKAKRFDKALQDLYLMSDRDEEDEDENTG